MTTQTKGLIMDDNIGVALSEVQFVTPVCRASYPNLLKPSEKTGKYGISLIFGPEADLSIMRNALIKAAQKKWGNQIPAKLVGYLEAGVTPETDTRGYPIHPGDKKIDDAGNTDPAYAGCLYINASSPKKKPKFGQKVNGVFQLSNDPEMARAGNYVRCSLTAFGYNFEGTKGVSLGLNNVMFVRYGEPLGTGTDPDSDFGSMGDSEVTSPLDPGDFGAEVDNDIPFRVGGPAQPDVSGIDLFS